MTEKLCKQCQHPFHPLSKGQKFCCYDCKEVHGNIQANLNWMFSGAKSASKEARIKFNNASSHLYGGKPAYLRLYEACRG